MQLTIPIPVGAFDASPFITEIEGLDDEPEDDPELDEAEADDGQVGVTVVEVQAQREETASSPRAIADDPDQQANERAGDPQSEHLEDGDIVFPESDAGEQPV
ncbi:MAG: hypothetical protein KDA85_19365, partial [Planctomycetaceae bacterium]|nr:hypothetical protein [Planctomycetaceae bacterium]